MVTFVVGPSTLNITDCTFEVLGARGNTVYDLRELRRFEFGTSGPDPVGLRCAGLASAFMVALAASWTYLNSLQVWVVAATFVVAPAVAGAARLRLRPPELTLTADYRGYHVQLLTTTDVQLFHQVRRALVRALERLR